MQTKELKSVSERAKAMIADNLDKYIREYGMEYLQSIWAYGDAPVDKYTFWNEIVRKEDDIAEFMEERAVKSCRKGYGTFDITADYFVQPDSLSYEWMSMDEDEMHDYVDDCITRFELTDEFINWLAQDSFIQWLAQDYIY